MKSIKRFSFRNRVNSFQYAFSGLRLLFREEHNARIHVVFALVAIVLGFLFPISILEWGLVVFAIGFVLVTEILNTSIENLADLISTERNKSIKTLKDLAAASVLVSAITACIIGMLVFIPKIYSAYF